MKFESTPYRMLEVFAMSEEGRQGAVILTGPDGKQVREEAGNGYYRWIKLPLATDGVYTLELDGCSAPLAYLSDCDDLLERGIRYLNAAAPSGRMEAEDLAQWYDTPYREQYHFNPYTGWLNDPNGLCWFEGYYHLYYQCNPFDQKWDNMHWGHAASRDLLHWVHLPVCLVPQESLRGKPDRKGGAFSGSAVVRDGEIFFYLTRHEGPQDDCEATVEYQTLTRSRDSIRFGEETTIIERPSPEVSYNFRDPKLFWKDGVWNLVLGSAVNKVPAWVRFTSRDGIGGWEYQGPMLTEPEPGIETIECPDCFELDGKFVAMGDLMWYHDSCGRYQPTRYYIGAYQDGQLSVESTGLLDFGTNYYAAQTFEHEGRRIAIAWVSDFYSEHKIAPDGAYGSIALPRELHLRDGKLYTSPVQEVYSLVGEQLASVQQGNLTVDSVPGNSYYVKLRLSGPTDFSCLLARAGQASISLICRNGVPEFKLSGTPTESVRFPAEVGPLHTVEIFVDRRTVEVYLNGGEAAGTKIFYPDSREGCFAAVFSDPDRVEELSLSRMDSVWGK